MAKTNKFQKDFKKFLDQARVKAEEWGKEIGVLAKKGEEKLVKLSRAGKIQLDIIGLHVEREKLYYDIGKKVVSVTGGKDLGTTEIAPYLKKLKEINKEEASKKKELKSVGKEKIRNKK